MIGLSEITASRLNCGCYTAELIDPSKRSLSYAWLSIRSLLRAESIVYLHSLQTGKWPHFMMEFLAGTSARSRHSPDQLPAVSRLPESHDVTLRRGDVTPPPSDNYAAECSQRSEGLAPIGAAASAINSVGGRRRCLTCFRIRLRGALRSSERLAHSRAASVATGPSGHGAERGQYRRALRQSCHAPRRSESAGVMTLV